MSILEMVWLIVKFSFALGIVAASGFAIWFAVRSLLRMREKYRIGHLAYHEALGEALETTGLDGANGKRRVSLLLERAFSDLPSQPLGADLLADLPPPLPEEEMMCNLGMLELVNNEADAELRVIGGLETNPEHRMRLVRIKGYAALLDGRYADAVAYLEEMKKKLCSEPQSHSWSVRESDMWLARAYCHLGRQSEGEGILEGLMSSASSANARGERVREELTAVEAKATLAAFLAARSERPRAESLILEVISTGSMPARVAHSLGGACAQLGRNKEAMRWLHQSATGFPCYPWYVNNPLLDPLRSDPEFQQILTDIRNEWESTKIHFARLKRDSLFTKKSES